VLSAGAAGSAKLVIKNPDVRFLYNLFTGKYSIYIETPDVEDVINEFFVIKDDTYSPIYPRPVLRRIIPDTIEALEKTGVSRKSKIALSDFGTLCRAYYNALGIRRDPQNSIIGLIKIMQMLNIRLGEVENFEDVAVSWARIPGPLQGILIKLLETQFDPKHLRSADADSEKNGTILSYLIPSIPDGVKADQVIQIVANRVISVIDQRFPQKPKLRSAEDYQNKIIAALEKLVR
jgi:hypothetical protein